MLLIFLYGKYGEPLVYGGRLIIVPYWLSRSPDKFYHLLEKEQVTILNQTPSAFCQANSGRRKHTSSTHKSGFTFGDFWRGSFKFMEFETLV